MSTMRRLRTRPSLLLAAGLLLASTGFAQEPTTEPARQVEAHQTWADEIGPDDVRVLGTVAEVREETFTLRALDAVYIFEIPSDPEQAADVRTGTDVQVWYDPASYERDGQTYYRVSRVTADDGQTAVAESTSTRDLESETSQSETSQSELAEAEAAEASAELRAEATVAESRTEELEATEATELEATESETYEAETESYQAAEAEATQSRELGEVTDDDEQALPQTAGALPLLAIGGLIALFGAAALRLFVS